jgi:hypothetical protein
MKTSTFARTAKKRPPLTGTLIGVRVQPSQLSALDGWIGRQPDPKPTRPEAIRLLLTERFRGDGYLDPGESKPPRTHF